MRNLQFNYLAIQIGKTMASIHAELFPGGHDSFAINMPGNTFTSTQARLPRAAIIGLTFAPIYNILVFTGKSAHQ